jgi:hypothetical protein
MSDIEFTNGSRINCIEPNESVRSSRSNMAVYYSEAYKKYHTIKGIWCMCEGLKWYQKVYMVLWSKWIDLKNHFTNPYARAMRRFVK